MPGRFTYTGHAREKMAERHITEADVEYVLEHWVTQFTDRRGNPLLGADVRGRRIRVVVARDSSPARIVTVYIA